MFGLNDEHKNISNLALDRIISLMDTDFIKSKEIDFEFMIGVNLPEGENPKKILLKIKASIWPYIKTKSFHGSQKVKDITAEYKLVELHLIIN